MKLTTMLRSALGLVALAPTAFAATESTWPVAGRQGLVQFVIVPAEQARERGAYSKQIAALCAPDSSCFLNFYTNSTGAPVALPLADAIDNEATAVFRRSAKQNATSFRWSCRMKMVGDDCF